MRDIPPALRAFPERRPVRLVMVARFGPQKDHATLLRALAKLTHREWHLDLIGDGPLMEQTRALAVDLGLTSRIRFLGERSDVDEFLANAQASLLVTNWEGFPRSILEAMRAGLPVIATSVAGIAEAVVDGDTGFLVPRGDVEMLRDRIDRVLIDPEVRQRLGANGRRRFEREFTLSVFLRNTFAVYRDLVGEPLADAPYAPAPDLATEQAS
jgi:glycosyltransferase involved in cell wall biosynthesis